MTFKSWKMVVGTVLVLLLIVGGSYFYLWRAKSCDELRVVDASIKVLIPKGRGYVGFNTDTDSLKFGGVSPGATSQRRVLVEYTKDALVNVTMMGSITSWTEISPTLLALAAGEKKEVIFDVTVPQLVMPGNYTGKAVFCFKDIEKP